MKRKGKIAIAILSILVFVAVSLFCGVYFVFLHRYEGSEWDRPFDPSAPFDLSKVKTVEKRAGEPFVILNLADVQLCDLEDFFHFNVIKEEILSLVDEVRPDLITLTGDQTWSNENLMSLKRLVRLLDSLRIPYAPVFGNHDGGNETDSAVLSRNACADVYEGSKYCLFDRGPSDVGGIGNYVVNVIERERIVKTLYLLDGGSEDTLTDRQTEWLIWNADGIKAANGGEYADGMCFMHKPLPEYREAYRAYLRGEAEAEGDVHVHYSLSGVAQTGFFEAATSRGVTDYVCGHQHGNNFSIRYRGARLTFAVKTGELGGAYREEGFALNGATYFVIEDGKTTVHHRYLDANAFRIDE